MDNSYIQTANFVAKARLEKNRFEEGFDFLITLLKNNSQGRPAKEYTVSLEVAKHICMMENTDKGHEVRKYFIECEKKRGFVQTS